MTCKDCVCYEILCRDTLQEDELTLCEYFKNKTDFVEVVRCKDCRQWNGIGFAENAGWCEKKDIGTLYNDFCSYGERRSKDG